MFWNMIVLYVIMAVVNSEFNSTRCPNVKTDLSLFRKRRHVTFPDGSNVVLTISLVKAFMTHAPSGWNLALELDVLFPLPDAKFTLEHSRRKLHHQQKREIWDRLSGALDFHNFNGRSCILRSLCDAKLYLLPPGTSLVHDLLRAIFTAPQHDDDFVEEIQSNYIELTDPNYCEKVNECPFSLISFLTTLQVS